MKKFLALVLAVLMIASTVVSVSAFTDVAEDYAHADAINALQEYSVVQGKSATEFAPEDNVTRLQMALFMARATTAVVDDAEWAEGDENLFADCTQYLGAIQYCFTQGIIKGVNATEFAPEANITLRDGVIMAVRALGYEKEDIGKDVYNKKYNVTGANYWLPYYQTAKEIGLLANLDKLAVTKALTRGETAQLIWNMLNTEVYVGGDDYNNNYTLADVVFGGKQIVNVNSVVAAYISETPLQSIGADTIGEDEEIVVITVLDELEDNPEVEVPFADLEEAGVDVENIEEYFGAYLELINCRVAYSGKDEDGYVVYKDYEYISGVSKANEVALTNADIQYHKNGDRIRINGKTHYFDEDSKARNYIAIYTATDAEDGWEKISDYKANDALYGKFYDVTFIDTDLDGYYEIGLVSFYNIAGYEAATSSGVARCGIMGDKDIKAKNVEYSESLTNGDVFVYTYNPFTNYVEVKEVLAVYEGKITGYESDKDDKVLTTTIEIDDAEYEIVDDLDTDDDDLVVSAFGDARDLNELIDSSITGETDLGAVTKEEVCAAADDYIGEEVEYYLYNGALLTFGSVAAEAAKVFLVVDDFTDFEIGEYVEFDAYIDGQIESIKSNTIYTLTESGAYKKNNIADLGYTKLSKLLNNMFGMFSYTVDADGFYVLKEYEPVLDMADFISSTAVANNRITFSGSTTKGIANDLDGDGSKNDETIRINGSTKIFFVNEQAGDVTIIKPSNSLIIPAIFDVDNDVTVKFIADKIGFGDPEVENDSVAAQGVSGIKHGVASILYLVTTSDYTSAINRNEYNIVYVDTEVDHVDAGDAESLGLESGEEDVTYYSYTTDDGQAYVVKSQAAVKEMFLSKDVRTELGGKLVPGVYLINSENIVADYVKTEDLEVKANQKLYVNNNPLDYFNYDVFEVKAADIDLFGNDYIRVNNTYGLTDNTAADTVKFRFFEEDNDGNVERVDKANRELIKYLEDKFAEGAKVKVLMVPNTPTGFDAWTTLPKNTLFGIVYTDLVDVDGEPEGDDDDNATVNPDAPKYTVSYFVGTTPFGTQTKEVGKSIVLIDSLPSNNGYTFLGWNTAADGTGDSYLPGATYIGNVDVILYAQFDIPAQNP